MSRPLRLVVALLPLGLAGCRDPSPAPPPAMREVDAGGASILSAFFGLDDALPMGVTFICPGGAGRDGMPVVFSRRVIGTPAAAAFEVTTRSGARRTPVCATLAPALGASERHTVLLAGDLGGEPGDPPARVSIVGSLPLEGGGDARGLTTAVVALAAGPSLVLALSYAPADLAGCPSPATRRVVQVTWNGGVTSPDGAPVGDRERLRMRVVVARGAGAAEGTPFALSTGPRKYATIASAPTRAAARPAPASRGRRLPTPRPSPRTARAGHGLPLRCKGARPLGCSYPPARVARGAPV